MISAAPAGSRTTVQIAGTSGGVGTTTVVALLFAALSQDVLGAPQLRPYWRANSVSSSRRVTRCGWSIPAWRCTTAAHTPLRQWSGAPIRRVCWCW